MTYEYPDAQALVRDELTKRTGVVEEFHRALSRLDHLTEQTEMALSGVLLPSKPTPNEPAPGLVGSVLSNAVEELHVKISRLEQLIGRCDL